MSPLAATILVVLVLPLLLAGLVLLPRTRAPALWLAPWAALPGLVLALAGGEGVIDVDWLLYGVEFGLTATARVFLLFTSGLWLAAGVYAGAWTRDDPQRARFFAFFLVTLAANLGLVIARDAIAFYLFFILMSLAAFGLVVHAGSREARRAGYVYLVLVVVGEMMILPALWLSASAAASVSLPDIAVAVGELPGYVTALFALGFGVKAGALPVHVWLPLAHPVAPTPASAVLSGAMIKAGLLAWLTFLPLGEAALPGFGAAFVVMGLSAAFYGALVGVVQARPKAVLAYSSISQMGLITVAVGVGLGSPEAAAAAVAAAALYALHHALAKGALFLGVGVTERSRGRRRWPALAALALPALALAGAPWTSGVVAKLALGQSVQALPGNWGGTVYAVLPVAAIGTGLLMARFLWLMARAPEREGATRGLWPAWLALLLAVASATWLVPPGFDAIRTEAASWQALWPALWPLACALVLAVVAGRLWRRPAPQVPEGDLLWPLLGLYRAVATRLPSPGGGVAAATASLRTTLEAGYAALERKAARGEAALMRWPLVWALAAVALLGLTLMLVLGAGVAG